MISLFRTTRLYPVFLLIVLAALMWIFSKSASYTLVPANGMPLYDLIMNLLSFLPSWFRPILGFTLITSQAIHFNMVLNKHEVLYKQTWIPALMYLLLAGLVPPFLGVHPLLFVNSLLIPVIDRLFSLYKNNSPMPLAFDGAFLLSIAALFYLPAAALLLFYFTGLLILRPFSWREWMVTLIGMTLPFFFALLYYFVNDDLYGFCQRVFVSGIKKEIDLEHFFNARYSPSIIVVGMLFLLSLLRVQANYFKNVNKTRLIQQLMILMIPVCLLSVLVAPDESLFRFNSLPIPLALYISYFFISGRKRWTGEVLFLLLLLGWVYNYYLAGD